VVLSGRELTFWFCREMFTVRKAHERAVQTDLGDNRIT